MVWNKRKVFKITKWVLIIYVVFGALLYYFQDKLLFHPTPLVPDYTYHFQQPFLELMIPVAKDRQLNVIRFTVDTAKRKGIALFFHGNRQNIERYSFYAPLFTRNGYEVWMMDYPGFGKSTGRHDEQNLYDDALILYKMALREMSSEHLIIYGKSLGTGIAAQLASKRDCKMLILETPYYNIAALALHYFPIYPVALTKYEFPTNAFLKNVKAPVYIFHGTADGVVPFAQGEKLASENKHVRLTVIKGGSHNDLFQFPLYQSTMKQLLTQ